MKKFLASLLRPKNPYPADWQSLRIVLTPRPGDHEMPEPLDGRQVENAIEAALPPPSVLDGNEYLGEEVVFYIATPDAEVALDAVRPVLRTVLCPAGHVDAIVDWGGSEHTESRRERIC